MPRVAPGGGVRVDGARLLAGPLVFLAAALIFLFCNILSHTQPRRGELDEYDEFVQMENAISTDNGLLALRGDYRCHRRGVFNESSESCRCPPLFSGDFCERPFCLHGDEVNEFGNCKCRPGHAGVHCERKCNGHQDNRTGACICSGQFFGIGCEFVCVNGHIVNGVCFCNHGFTGLSCSTCTDSSSSSCPSASSSASLRRSSVQSRLTLSGLSFCLLTLGLLCLSARRRRLQAHAAEARRRQQAPIRQLLLGLAPISEEELAEGRSASTPPPEYMATMSTPQGLPPPSYEEAMRGGGGEAESEEGRTAVDDIEGCRRSLSSLIKDEDEEEREQQERREGEERERFEESTSRTSPLDKDAAL